MQHNTVDDHGTSDYFLSVDSLIGSVIGKTFSVITYTVVIIHSPIIGFAFGTLSMVVVLVGGIVLFFNPRLLARQQLRTIFKVILKKFPNFGIELVLERCAVEVCC